jgi:hypothetical protein
MTITEGKTRGSKKGNGITEGKTRGAKKNQKKNTRPKAPPPSMKLSAYVERMRVGYWYAQENSHKENHMCLRWLWERIKRKFNGWSILKR